MQIDNSDKADNIKTILVVDDSLVFRKFLENIFEDREDFLIIGEARNGIEALEMVLEKKPDVILLDMEMPLMDGMTALQHLMIHRPTPIIMFSSLTEEGTARCFDTMKNGAVDFVCKDFLFQKKSLENHKKLLIEKVKKAVRIKLKAREPAFSSIPSSATSASEGEQQVVFCEDCGYREILPSICGESNQKITCSQCGDTLEIGSSAQLQYRRNSFLTVLGGGEGSFFNLLEIIPNLGPEIGGALIAVIHQNVAHVNEFAEYLDAISPMKVIRAREGINLEGGCCYILSGQDFMSIKPYSAQLTLRKVPQGSLQGGPLDTLLASVSTVYKKRAAGIILSGSETDGDIGMSILIKNDGHSILLDPDQCYCTDMGEHITRKCNITDTCATDGVIEIVRQMHQQAKYDSIAG